MALFNWKKYRGDPDPLLERSQLAGVELPEPLEWIQDTPQSGTGHTIGAFVPLANVPTVGTAPLTRSYLALMPINFDHVKFAQAGGARRLFANNVIGARNQSPTIQNRDSQRIVRPSAGPWDRGGAVGGN